MEDNIRKKYVEGFTQGFIEGYFETIRGMLKTYTIKDLLRAGITKKEIEAAVGNEKELLPESFFESVNETAEQFWDNTPKEV